MAFRMQYTVSMACGLEEARKILLDSKNFVQLQEVAPSCKKCEVLSQASPDQPTAVESLLTKEELIRCLDSQNLPTHLPWPSLSNPQDHPHATYFKFVEMGNAHVSGSQIISEDLNVVFFHSHVPSAGIEEYKLRVLQEEENGKSVRVSETVWGKAPWLLSKALSMSGLARKTHAKHMNLYHTLIGRIE